MVTVVMQPCHNPRILSLLVFGIQIPMMNTLILEVKDEVLCYKV